MKAKYEKFQAGNQKKTATHSIKKASTSPISGKRISLRDINPCIVKDPSFENLLRIACSYEEAKASAIVELYEAGEKAPDGKQRIRREHLSQENCDLFISGKVSKEGLVALSIQRVSNKYSATNLEHNGKCIAIAILEPDTIIKVFSCLEASIIYCSDYACLNGLKERLEKFLASPEAERDLKEMHYLEERLDEAFKKAKHRSTVWLPDAVNFVFRFNGLRPTESHLERNGDIPRSELLASNFEIPILLHGTNKIEHNQSKSDSGKVGATEVNGKNLVEQASFDEYVECVGDELGDSESEMCLFEGDKSVIKNDETAFILQAHIDTPETHCLKNEAREEQEVRRERIHLLEKLFLQEQNPDTKWLFQMRYQNHCSISTIASLLDDLSKIMAAESKKLKSLKDAKNAKNTETAGVTKSGIESALKALNINVRDFFVRTIFADSTSSLEQSLRNDVEKDLIVLPISKSRVRILKKFYACFSNMLSKEICSRIEADVDKFLQNSGSAITESTSSEESESESGLRVEAISEAEKNSEIRPGGINSEDENLRMFVEKISDEVDETFITSLALNCKRRVKNNIEQERTMLSRRKDKKSRIISDILTVLINMIENATETLNTFVDDADDAEVEGESEISEVLDKSGKASKAPSASSAHHKKKTKLAMEKYLPEIADDRNLRQSNFLKSFECPPSRSSKSAKKPGHNIRQEILRTDILQDLFVLPLQKLSGVFTDILGDKEFTEVIKYVIKKEIQLEINGRFKLMFEEALDAKDSEFWSKLREKLRSEEDKETVPASDK